MADRIGFIGLGVMGKPMGLNILKHGFSLAVHSRSHPPVMLVAAGARSGPVDGRGSEAVRHHNHDGAGFARRTAGR